MVHENSQFDIPGIQLRESKTQPKVSLSREIGEAQITYTIFGKAKVRIIRKNDKLHRALWLTAATGGAAIAVAVWQGLFMPQQVEPLENAVPIPAVSSGVQAGTPAFEPVDTAPPADLSAKAQPTSSPATGISAPEVAKKVAPQPSAVAKDAENTFAKSFKVQPKPVTAQPEATGKQPELSPVASKSAPRVQTDKPLPGKLQLPKQPAPPVVVTPPAIKPTTLHAVSSPAVAPSLAAPLVKDDASTQLPADNNQLSPPINVQGK